MNAERETVLIVGLGNEWMGDDGLGVHVARALLALGPDLPHGVEVLDAGMAVFDVLPEMPRYARVILVDAISVGREPGCVYRAELDREPEPGDGVAGSPLALSLHQSGALDAIAAARLLRLLPERLTLIGAEPERIEPAVELSPNLRRAAARIVSALLTETGSPVSTA